MKVFNYGGSINFIDENDVFLGYELSTSCSEFADYKLFYDRKGKKEVTYKNYDELNDILDGYFFDITFMVSFYDDKNTKSNIALFRLINESNNSIYLGLSNRHNGYYVHGFCLEKIDISDYSDEEYECSFGKYCREIAPRVQYFFQGSI